MRVGSALTHLAKEMEEADPSLAAKLRRAVSKYYPDAELGLEVQTPDGTIRLFDFGTQRSHALAWELVRRVRPLVGSVDLHHYSTRSAYSTDDTAFPYKLVRFWMGDEEDDEADWEAGCLLFADGLVAHASSRVT